MEDIDKMADWSILTYLRNKRNCMAQSHFTKEDIENDFGYKFRDDEEWEESTDFSCDAFDNVKHDLMYVIIEEFKQCKT